MHWGALCWSWACGTGSNAHLAHQRANVLAVCARTVDTTERAGQKIILRGQLANLGLHVLDARTLRLALLSRRQEHPHRPFEQLRLPLRDLVGVHIETSQRALPASCRLSVPPQRPSP